MAYTDRQLSEDIYDIIKVCALSDNQTDDYAQMSRRHAEDARKNLRKFLGNKEMQWWPESNTVVIGKHIIITVERI